MTVMIVLEKKSKPSEVNEVRRQLASVGLSLRDCVMTEVIKEDIKDVKAEYGNKTKLKKGECVEYRGQIITHSFRGYIDALHTEILNVKPTIIVCLGEVAMFAVLGESGIDEKRGSMETYKTVGFECSVMPTYSPMRCWKNNALKYLTGHDLGRVVKAIETGGWVSKEYNIIYGQDFETTKAKLLWLLNEVKHTSRHVSCDIETRKHFYIGTIQFAWSDRDAIVIPILNWDMNPYWFEHEEFELVCLIRQLLSAPKVRLSGHNFHYDAQYIGRHWGVLVRLEYDTQTMFRCCFNMDLSKSLRNVASIMCEHYVYWKDESQAEGEDRYEPSEDAWDSYLMYAGKDACYTWECAEELIEAVKQFDVESAWVQKQNDWLPALRIMLYGVKIDMDRVAEHRRNINARIKQLEAWMEYVLEGMIGNEKTPFWNSPKQKAHLFYTVFGYPVISKRGSTSPTVDELAIRTIAMNEPALKPICDCLLLRDKLVKFKSNFLNFDVDFDGRLHAQIQVVQSSDYRNTSSKNDCFDKGFDLVKLFKG